MLTQHQAFIKSRVPQMQGLYSSQQRVVPTLWVCDCEHPYSLYRPSTAKVCILTDPWPALMTHTFIQAQHCQCTGSHRPITHTVMTHTFIQAQHCQCIGSHRPMTHIVMTHTFIQAQHFQSTGSHRPALMTHTFIQAQHCQSTGSHRPMTHTDDTYLYTWIRTDPWHTVCVC